MLVPNMCEKTCLHILLSLRQYFRGLDLDMHSICIKLNETYLISQYDIAIFACTFKQVTRVCPLQWGYRKRKDFHNAWQLQRKSEKLPVFFPALRHSSSFMTVGVMQLLGLDLACIKCIWRVCAGSVLRVQSNASRESVTASCWYSHQLL